MNGVNLRYGKYMNGLCFSLRLVYELCGVRGHKPHVDTQNHRKLTPRFAGVNIVNAGVNIQKETFTKMNTPLLYGVNKRYCPYSH